MMGKSEVQTKNLNLFEPLKFEFKGTRKDKRKIKKRELFCDWAESRPASPSPRPKATASPSPHAR
jgi:hypothetical protein